MISRHLRARRHVDVTRKLMQDWNPAMDGIDHINIGEREYIKTALGKHLAHFTEMPFEHPYLGLFHSMEGYWHFIRDREQDPRFRTLAHHRARELGHTKVKDVVKRRFFRDLIMDGNFYKIQQNSVLKKELVTSTLPITNYYLMNAQDNRPRVPIYPKVNWIAQDIMELRAIFALGEEFDYVPISPEEYALIDKK